MSTGPRPVSAICSFPYSINKFLFFFKIMPSLHIFCIRVKKNPHFKSGELCESVWKQKHENVKGTIRGKWMLHIKYCISSLLGYSSPKPSEFEIPMISFCFRSFLLLYGGRQSWLKQVCATGNLGKNKFIKDTILKTHTKWLSNIKNLHLFRSFLLFCDASSPLYWTIYWIPKYQVPSGQQEHVYRQDNQLPLLNSNLKSILFGVRQIWI